jgi:hypothetical protein
MTSVLFAAAEGEAHHNELIFDPVWFGVIAFGVLMALLALLWSFRNTLALDPHTEHEETGTDVSASPDSGRSSH